MAFPQPHSKTTVRGDSRNSSSSSGGGGCGRIACAVLAETLTGPFMPLYTELSWSRNDRMLDFIVSMVMSSLGRFLSGRTRAGTLGGVNGTDAT